MPRGALLGAGRIPHDAPEPMRVARPVTPGPLWRNPGHAFLSAPPLAFGGKAKERKTGVPPRPSKELGPTTLGLFSDNEDGMSARLERCSSRVERRWRDGARCAARAGVDEAKASTAIYSLPPW